jgi:hypothetical protein
MYADKNSPYPSILVLSSGTGSARFSIKRFNCSLIAARKLDCLLASRLCIGLVLFSEQCSRDLAQVGRSSDGTLAHLKSIVFAIIEYEFFARTYNATLFCCGQIMTETHGLR